MEEAFPMLDYKKCVTEVAKLNTFYKAGESDQNYYSKNEILHFRKDLIDARMHKVRHLDYYMPDGNDQGIQMKDKLKSYID